MASVIGCLPFGWGNGNGTFQPETVVNLPDNIEDLGIVPGDFNSDGLLDFISLCSQPQEVFKSIRKSERPDGKGWEWGAKSSPFYATGYYCKRKRSFINRWRRGLYRMS
jgi:hypothetical protein